MMGPPPGGPDYDKLKPKKPKGLRDVPRYLKEALGGFFSRLFYVFRLVWEAKPWILFFMIGNSVLNGIFPVVGALISKELINTLVDVAVKGEGEFSEIMKLLIFLFVFTFLSALITLVYNMVLRISGEVVTNHIKLKILNKTKEIDMSSFDRPEFYEKLENASREAGMRPIQILQSVFGIVSAVISLISFIVILISVSPWAPLVIIVFSVPAAIISFVYRKKNFEYMRRRSKDRRQMQYYGDLLTNKDMVKEIRMFDLSDTFIDCYKETFGRYFLGIKKLIYAEGAWNSGVSLASSGVNCALFLYLAKKVYDGAIAVGDFTLYTGALQSIASGVTSLISTFAMIYEGTLFIDNMIAFMKEKGTIKPVVDEPLHVKRGVAHKIEFKDVWFTYPGSDHPVIKGVDLTINEGETAVLVGLNGAGKTTLIKLLTRLYDPTSGVILFDGEDIRKYDVKELYGTFGIIFQDFGKYAFTAGENIMFGEISKGYDEKAIREAAKNADADGFISKLSKGYSTSLMKYFEPDGTELSIGQWQKLSVARAFYADSDFLILDEPTASLDAIAEQEIFNQFEKLREGKTTLFVSHRLSSATTATKIFVIDGGEKVEEGTHEELMKLGGKYCELFTTQAKRYVTGSGAPDHPKMPTPPKPPKEGDINEQF
ncbi:MAG: ABC transporter ATP-binding protein [Clostridia bacterium]|nr:ABC transporter ATP-binding protein [Clostridia bacterium]